VLYLWEWFKFPSAEDIRFGEWSQERIAVTCTSATGDFVVPARSVKPVGWYNGPHLWWLFGKRLPKFTQLEVNVHGGAGTTFPKRIVPRFEDSIAVLRLDGMEPTWIPIKRER